RCSRVENSGMARTISSGGDVCLSRERTVGPRLPIRSGTVESETITRRSPDFLLLAKVSRMKRTCRRCFLLPGSRRLRPSTPKMTRAAQISGNMGTRSTSYDQRIFRDDTDNNYTHSRDCLAAAGQLKYESMAEQQRMRWSMASTEMEQSDSGQQSEIKAVLLFFAAFALYLFTHSP